MNIKKIYKIIINSLLITLFLFSNVLGIENIGEFGNTYKILEPDALKEIKQASQNVDWQSVLNKKKKEAIKNFKPKNLKKLIKATQDNTFLVDLTYTLNFDIPDGKGGLLYPKGFQFNPLKHVSYYKTIIVIDETDKEQVKWLLKLKELKNINTVIMLSDGSYYDLIKKINKPVYYISNQIIKRFKLKKVPSIVKQEGLFMRVQEIFIKD